MIKKMFKTVRGFAPIELVVLLGFGVLVAGSLIFMATKPAQLASMPPVNVNVQPPAVTVQPADVNVTVEASRTPGALADTAPAGTTLAAVKAYGKLKAATGPGDDQGWHVWSGTSATGFEPDIAHAIAAAVLDDSSKVEFTKVAYADRFSQLDAGDYDVVIAYNTPSFSREAFYNTHFGAIYYYTAISIMQKNATISKIGVLDAAVTGTTLESTLDGWLASSGITTYQKVLFNTPVEMYAAYSAGTIDAICDDLAVIQGSGSTYNKVFNIADDKYAMAVREGDGQWKNIVDLSFWAMVVADQVGLNKANMPKNVPSTWTSGLSQGYTADQLVLMGVPMPVYGAKKKQLGYITMGDLLGLNPRWAYNIITQVGSYSDIFSKNFPGMPQGVNQSYPKGLIYPHYFDGFWIPGSFYGTNGYVSLRSNPTL